MNPNASDLEATNAKYDELTKRLDAYYNSLSADVRSAVNGAISKWQDYYYGDNSGDPKLLGGLQVIYTKANNTLNAAIAAGAKPSAAKDVVAAKPATQAQVQYVTAANSFGGFTIPDIREPKPYVLALLAGAVLYLMFHNR